MEPWETEPAFVLFKHRNMQCVIVRVPHSGHLCGYVGVPEWHPWFGKDYDEIDASVHGGLTWAREELPSAIEADFGIDWWIGFDCAHGGDLMPRLPTHLGGTYRDVEYVKKECCSLVEQMEAANAPT